MGGDKGFPHKLVFRFPSGKWVAWKKFKKIDYLCIVPPIFFILSRYVWENNGLLNKNYWDDLEVIDQGHGYGNISEFYLYLGYPWTNFNKISTTMMASRPATKNVLSFDLKNVGHGHHL